MNEVLVGQTPIIPPTPSAKIPPAQEGRQRTSLNLSNIGKVEKTSVEKPVTKPEERTPDRPIDQAVLQKAWEDFIELRKAITRDLSILKRGYTMEASIIKLELIGHNENMLFDTMKTSLITFLRERTGNSSLLIQTQIVESTVESTKPRTTKEKFNHLAEKNPVLKELKERFGLDPDLA